MSRNPLLRLVLAAVLVLALLLPSTAAARGPAVPAPVWEISFWDLLRWLLPVKNGSQIDPDGLKNQGTIDPDGLENGSQIDPNGLTSMENDNRGTIDPNG